MKWCAVLAVISSLCGLGQSFFGDHTTFQCIADERHIWGHPGSSCGRAAVLEQGCRSSVPLGVKPVLSADTKARPVPVLPKTQQQPQCALKCCLVMCIQAKKMPFRATCIPQRDGATSPRASPGTGQGRAQDGHALPAGWWGQASTGHVPGALSVWVPVRLQSRCSRAISASDQLVLLLIVFPWFGLFELGSLQILEDAEMRKLKSAQKFELFHKRDLKIILKPDFCFGRCLCAC